MILFHCINMVKVKHLASLLEITSNINIKNFSRDSSAFKVFY